MENTFQWRKLCPRPTKKSFLSSDIKADDLRKLSFSNLWEDQKLALLHRNCPLDVAQRLSGDDKWYKRLVAYMATPNRHKMWKRALNDPKSTVRAAAYRTSWYFGMESATATAQRVLDDIWVHGYFRSDLDACKRLVGGEMSEQEFING